MEYRIGEVFGGFRLIDTMEIPEYESKGLLFEHERTGCRAYDLLNNDDENVLSFIFRTPPGNNKGVAHILEHVVLSGSKKYPVKDPFVALMRGSMCTFLNALTYPDKTVFPAATRVKKDFFNLLSVYGDAVFSPLLRKEAFEQEGLRFVLGDHGHIGADGVVYNEMRGAYGSHETIVGEWSYRTLFPDSIYRFDSGGEPAEIIDLRYDEFIEYYKKWYHPSNCLIFLYGDIPPEETLSFIDDRFLSSFVRAETDTSIGSQRELSEPIVVRRTSPLGHDEDPKGKSTITVNWLAGTVHDSLKLLSLEVLAEILLGNSGSPLHKTVTESTLGEDLSPVSGLDTHTKELVFSVGIRGTDPERRKEFEDLVLSELSRLADEGIPDQVVQGAMRRVEFHNREIRGGAPFGLTLMGKTLRGWLHGESPERTLEFEPWMNALKRKASEVPGYFEKLIREMFIENSHRSMVIVRPDPEHEERETARLEKKLESIERTLDETGQNRLREENESFRRFQERPDDPEDLARIPTLSVSDLPGNVETIDLLKRDDRGYELYTLSEYTNGIVYTDIAVDITDFREDEAIDLPLFCRAVCGTGLPGVPYDEIARLQALHTGGFTSFLESNTRIVPRSRERSLVIFRLKALEENFQDALDLALKLVLQADFSDTGRMRDLLLELRNDFRTQLIPAGHSFAALRAGSRLSRALRSEERWKGIDQLLHLEELVRNNDIEALCKRLETIRSSIIRKRGVSAIVTADGDAIGKAESQFRAALERIPGDDSFDGGRSAPEGVDRSARVSGPEAAQDSGSETRAAAVHEESIVLPSSVAYVATVLRSSHFDRPEHPSEVLLAHLLKTGLLWEEVRMRGGAYGVFAAANGGESIFTFSSYRDPRISETLDAFRAALTRVAETGATRDELDKAIISVVSRDIRPMSPAEKSIIGLRRRLYGISDDMRQRKREELLATKPSELAEAARRILDGFDDAYTAVMAGKDAVEAAASRNPGLGEHMIVLPV